MLEYTDLIAKDVCLIGNLCTVVTTHMSHIFCINHNGAIVKFGKMIWFLKYFYSGKKYHSRYKFIENELESQKKNGMDYNDVEKFTIFFWFL